MLQGNQDSLNPQVVVPDAKVPTNPITITGENKRENVLSSVGQIIPRSTPIQIPRLDPRSYNENRPTPVEMFPVNLGTPPESKDQKDPDTRQLETKEPGIIKLTDEEEKIYEEIFQCAAQAIQAQDLESLKMWLGPAVYEPQFQYDQACYHHFIFWTTMEEIQALCDKVKKTMTYCEETFEQVQRHKSAFERYENMGLTMRLGDPLAVQQDSTKLNTLRQAHQEALEREAKVGNNYREAMQRHEALYKEEEFHRYEKFEKPLVLTPEQAQIAFNRIKAELEACKKALLDKLELKLEETSKRLHQEREEFLSLEEIRKRYKEPILHLQSTVMQEFLDEFLSNLEKFLPRKNFPKLIEEYLASTIENLEASNKVSKKQKADFEKTHKEKTAAENEAYQKAFAGWVEKLSGDQKPKLTPLQEECLKKLKAGEIKPFELAKIKDKKGNTLFHWLLPSYLAALHKTKQKKSKQKKDKRQSQEARANLKNLQEMAKVLFEHGFLPFQRKKMKGERTVEVAFEYANKVFEELREDKGNKKCLLPDWYLLVLCLQHIPTYTESARRMLEHHLKYCENAKKDSEGFRARVDQVLSEWFGVENVLTQREERRDQATKLTEYFYVGSFELSDEVPIDCLEFLKRTATRIKGNFFRLATVAAEMKKEKKVSFLPTTPHEIEKYAYQAEIDKQKETEEKMAKMQKDQEEFRKKVEERERRNEEVTQQLLARIERMEQQQSRSVEPSQGLQNSSNISMPIAETKAPVAMGINQNLLTQAELSPVVVSSNNSTMLQDPMRAATLARVAVDSGTKTELPIEEIGISQTAQEPEPDEQNEASPSCCIS